MLIDGHSLPNGTHLGCDICIVGGGFAGLLLAERLGRLKLDVCVLESGSQDVATWETLDALRVETTSEEYGPCQQHRSRGVGGTANIWNTFIENRPAARYFRMESVDLEARPGLPNGGWPFGLDELARDYADAEARVMPAFSVAEQRRLESSHGLPFDPERVSTVAEAFGFAELFVREIPEALSAHPRVKLITHATATEILTEGDSAEAKRIRVLAGTGRTFTVGFRVLVLATGTLDNTRLLLSSTGTHPLGLGNQNDVVGRYYMDHQRLNAGRLFPAEPSLFDRTALFDLRAHDRQYWMGKIKLSSQVIRQEGLLNSSTLLWPRPTAEDDRGVDAAKELARLIRKGKLGKTAQERLMEVLHARTYLLSTGPRLALAQRTLSPNITRGGWSLMPRNHQRFSYFEMVQQIEQAPDPDNRVTLSEKRDRYGIRLPHVEARFLDIDLESAQRSQRLLADEFDRAGIGRVVFDEGVPFPDMHQKGGIHHPLGGTRMHANPKYGVVDANCKLHDVPNVFVTGGSVFPTGGYANPNLTIAALSLRLGRHLEKFSRPAAVRASSQVAQSPTKVLVTGASGFVGGYVVRELLRRGHRVRGLVRPGREASVGELQAAGMEIALGDISKPDTLGAAFEGVDAVIHLAAVVGKDPGGWDHHEATGVRGTDAVLAAASTAGIRRFIHLSSAVVYKAPPPGTAVTEDSPLEDRIEPWNHYLRQKLVTERAVLEKSGEFDVTVIRPPTVIGPGDPNLVPMLDAVARSPLGAVAADGDRHFPVVVAEDLATGIAEALERPVAIGRTYNIASSERWTKQRLLEAFEEAGIRFNGSRNRRLMLSSVGAGFSLAEHALSPLGPQVATFHRRLAVPRLEEHAHRRAQPDLIVDASRAREELGFSGGSSCLEAIARTAHWFRALPTN